MVKYIPITKKQDETRGRLILEKDRFWSRQRDRGLRLRVLWGDGVERERETPMLPSSIGIPLCLHACALFVPVRAHTRAFHARARVHTEHAPVKKKYNLHISSRNRPNWLTASLIPPRGWCLSRSFEKPLDKNMIDDEADARVNQS